LGSPRAPRRPSPTFPEITGDYDFVTLAAVLFVSFDFPIDERHWIAFLY
jgi:hypothetical protein